MQPQKWFIIEKSCQSSETHLWYEINSTAKWDTTGLWIDKTSTLVGEQIMIYFSNLSYFCLKKEKKNLFISVEIKDKNNQNFLKNF